MKRLTMDQLRELRVFNPHEFCRSFWYVDYDAGDGRRIGRFWCLHFPCKPNPDPKNHFSYGEGYGQIGYGNDGRTKPADLNGLRELLRDLNAPYPDRWIKFMGTWMDADLYEKRMTELVAMWKAAQSTPEKEGEK